jgi:hypothetical protein
MARVTSGKIERFVKESDIFLHFAEIVGFATLFVFAR